MSADEDFLSRWSRRKRENADAGREPFDAHKPPADEPESDGMRTGDADGGRDRAAGGVPEEAPAPFDPASLPSLDSIDATTDIRSFLQPGVPASLRNAALRRVWTADPAIRDYIGLSEYSWDFNVPNEIHGFGPLDQSQVPQLLEEVFGKVRDKVAEAVADAKEPAGETQASAAGGHGSTVAQGIPVPSGNAGPPSSDTAVQRADRESSSDESAQPQLVQRSMSAVDAVDTARDGAMPSQRQRGHGRALPE